MHRLLFILGSRKVLPDNQQPTSQWRGQVHMIESPIDVILIREAKVTHVTHVLGGDIQKADPITRVGLPGSCSGVATRHIRNSEPDGRGGLLRKY
jgi:hypothetical protein